MAQDPIEGVDLSSNNGPTPDVTGLGFVWCRASEGMHFTDATYVSRMTFLKDKDVVPGSYHTLEAGDGAGQCERFLSITAGLAGDVHLYAVDAEPYPDPPTLHSHPADMIAFHTRFHELMPGRLLFVYSNPAYWHEAFSDLQLNCPKCRLWAASIDHIPKPHEFVDGLPRIYGGFPDFTIHQYDQKGVDNDRFYGTRAELVALASAGLTSRFGQFSGDDMIHVIHNQKAGESRFVQLTDQGLRVFAPMSGEDLHLVNVLAVAGAAKIVAVDDDRAWQTAIAHQA